MLAADDNPLNLELIEGCLSEVGCTFVSAADGEQALRIVRAAPPDLVLLDVMMPKLDGFEVCRRIRDLPGGNLIPVVLLTALGAVEDRVRGLEAGADEFLVKPIDGLELVARVRSLLRLKELRDGLDDAKSVIFALARAVEAKSGRIATGVDSVGMTARKVGIELGLTGGDLDDLEWGGAIRDIGKIGVPDAILLKPSPLTPAEYDLVRKHVLIGEEIAMPLQSTRHLVPIIRHHHEWVNGAGYPDGLAGDAIPLGARVVAVCDAFHALTSDRPYRKRRSPARALAVLAAGAGSQWDVSLVRLLEGIVAGYGRPAGGGRQMGLTGI